MLDDTPEDESFYDAFIDSLTKRNLEELHPEELMNMGLYPFRDYQRPPKDQSDRDKARSGLYLDFVLT